MKSIQQLFNLPEITFSFEFFPPKNQETYPAFIEAIQELKKFNPLFISVTYGAMGKTQEKTLEVVADIKNNYNVETMVHFTCIGARHEEIDRFLQELKKIGIDEILALRGDIPQGISKEKILYEFKYASDLVKYIKIKASDFTICVAGYPEGHMETPDLDLSLQHLKQKVDAGADFIITQLFFDNSLFYRFVEKARAIGIDIPILPGIMPSTNYKTIEKITQMCKVHIPSKIVKFFTQKDISIEDMKKFAIDYTYNQCLDLEKNGFYHFHFYTLNKSSVVKDVCDLLLGL